MYRCTLYLQVSKGTISFPNYAHRRVFIIHPPPNYAPMSQSHDEVYRMLDTSLDKHDRGNQCRVQRDHIDIVAYFLFGNGVGKEEKKSLVA